MNIQHERIIDLLRHAPVPLMAREIADELNLSTPTVAKHLGDLAAAYRVKKGMIWTDRLIRVGYRAFRQYEVHWIDFARKQLLRTAEPRRPGYPQHRRPAPRTDDMRAMLEDIHRYQAAA